MEKDMIRNWIEIKKGGKQKLSYIDIIGKGRLVDTIAIQSFKEYNFIDEVTNNRKNNCCFIFWNIKICFYLFILFFSLNFIGFWSIYIL